MDDEIRAIGISPDHQAPQGRDLVWSGMTLRDIRAFVKGMHYSLEQLLPEVVRYDAWAQGIRFDLPVFVF
jgi:hypothetical protein